MSEKRHVIVNHNFLAPRVVSCHCWQLAFFRFYCIYLPERLVQVVKAQKNPMFGFDENGQV